MTTRILKLGQRLSQQIDRGQGFERRHVAGASHHNVGLKAFGFGTGPRPYSNAGVAVGSGLLHGQPLRGGLLAGNDHVDAIIGPKTMVGNPEQRIGIGRKIDANDVGLLVDHEIDETGILMAEAVVVLSPDV